MRLMMIGLVVAGVLACSVAQAEMYQMDGKELRALVERTKAKDQELAILRQQIPIYRQLVTKLEATTTAHEQLEKLKDELLAGQSKELQQAREELGRKDAQVKAAEWSRNLGVGVGVLAVIGAVLW